MKKLSLLLLGASLPLNAVAVVPSSSVMGDWATPTTSVVRIYPCGNAVCAKIVKLSKDAPDKMDSKNPESSLRNRRLCGLDVGSGFHQVDASHLENGHLYDPKNGHTYSGTIVANGDQLNLRGYIGISLLGRTEIWHRSPVVDPKNCE
jgi:uncharacterized protein (DUF2147 family)